MTPQQPKPERSAALVRYLIIATIVLLLALLFVRENSSGVLIALVALLILLVALPYVHEFSDISFGPEGLVLRRRVRELESATAGNAQAINKFIFLAMPEPMFENLKKFSAPSFGPYRMTDGFRQQIRHLRDTGLVTVKGRVGDLTDGLELNDYVWATKLGQEFIERREQIVQGKSVTAER